MKNQIQSPPLYAWYGDDFTGSTDVLEALGINGVKAVLFTRAPGKRELARFADCAAIGIAGESRSRNPQWLSRNLPAIFRTMRSLGAPINHYKVCSTFDSAPRVGNIGRAIELGRAAFRTKTVPVVVGAPHLGRAVVFGNLFAEAEGKMYRIDRHPTMRQHPVTPMNESDLRRHLAKQTALRIGLVDLNAFQKDAAQAKWQSEVDSGAEAVIFDGFSDAMLQETARIICSCATKRPLFAIGSSGLTQGLVHYWRQCAMIGPAGKPAPATPVDRLLVLSGSCSSVTAGQIRRAAQLGFIALRLQGSAPWRAQTTKAHEALCNGRSVVLFTALGSETGRIKHGKEFSTALGTMLRDLIITTGVRRVLIAGGDTATHAVKQLEIGALTFAAPLAPGVPLCLAHASTPPLDRLQLALKGGQIGPEDFFVQVRDGQSGNPSELPG